MIKRMKIRSLLIGIFFFILFFILIGKLYWIQVVEASGLRKLAEEVWTRNEILKPVRGMISDRKDRPLAEDSVAYTVAVNPKVIHDRNIEKEAAQGLAQVLSTTGTPEDIARLEDKFYNYVTKKKPNSNDYAIEVEIPVEGWKVDAKKKQQVDDMVKSLQSDLKEKTGVLYKSIGIYTNKTTRRSYPNDRLASHILGYTDKDGIAKMGLENSLNDLLTGTPGKWTHEKDLKGVEIPNSKVSLTPAVNGKNVRLTIDQTIQYYVETALKKAYDKWKPKSMTVIAADPKTMEILAMANAPDFNPNKYWEIDSQKDFKNVAISSQYEPGSTFKLVTLAGAIEEGMFHPDDKFLSGSIAVPGNNVYDHNRVGWGKISYMDGLLRSSNVAFVKLGYEMMGEKKIDDYMAKFGFGTKTGIDLPGEVAGQTKLKYPSDYARATFGQSVTVTALQQLAAYGAIANNGKLMKPYVIKDILNPDTNEVEQSFSPQEVRQVVSPETAKQTVLDLEQVVANQELGTGRRAYINGYRVAGKTGTANIVPEGAKAYSDDTWLISFAGIAPVEDPKIVLIILADQPELGGDFHKGSEVAPPMFKEIVSQTLNYMGIAPADVKESKAISEAASVVPDLTGQSVEDAKKKLSASGYKSETIGGGAKVLNQLPKPGSEILLSQKVYLLTENNGSTPVPDLTGKSLRDAMEVCSLLGIQIRAAGEGYVSAQQLKEENGLKILELELKAISDITANSATASGSDTKKPDSSAGKTTSGKSSGATTPPAKATPKPSPKPGKSGGSAGSTASKTAH